MSDEEVKFTEFIFEEEEPPQFIEKAPRKTKRLLFVRDICTHYSKINRNITCLQHDDIPRATLEKILDFIFTSMPPLKGGNSQNIQSAADLRNPNNLSDLYIVSSPLMRAEHTSKLLCKKLGIPHNKIKYHEYFREVKLKLHDLFEGEEEVYDTKETFGKRLRDIFHYITHNIKESNIIIITHEKFISQLTEKTNLPGDYYETEFDIF